MTRSEILKEAEKCVCGEREQDYGKPENNFKNIAGLWKAYLAAAHPGKFSFLAAKDVAIMMALLKIARIATGENPDSFVDLAGYAACAGEIATNQRSNSNFCISCGVEIPEGRQICWKCENDIG